MVKPPVPLWRQLQSCADVVAQVAQGRSATEALAAVEAPLRPATQALSLTVLRHYGHARAVVALLVQRAPRPWVHALLCSAVALMSPHSAQRYDAFTLVNQVVEAVKRRRKEAHQDGFVNASLRRYLREREALESQVANDLQARWNFPLWWIQRLQADHPDHWQQILEASNHSAPMSLRVNVRQSTQAQMAEKLHAAGVACRPQGAHALVLDKPLPVAEIPGFFEGEVSVQDAAAQRAAELLLDGVVTTPATRILDACAAPGGKTGHLLELSAAKVVALEVDPARAGRINDNLERLKLQAQVLCASALDVPSWWDGQAFDLILLDAPCTASGIVRRHPDVRWLRRESDVDALARTQADMLSTLWPLLKPGGRLLFCTCSVFAAEGRAQPPAFLQKHPDAVSLPSPGHLLPTHSQPRPDTTAAGGTDHDGFFYALFEKAAR